MIEKIMQIVKNKGPVLPSDITKPTGLDTLFAGAHLSQLVDAKKLKITHVKKGGSPFYYLPGQEEQLLDLTSYLTDKEKQIFDQLKKKKVLRDAHLGASDKVVIKTLRDFAMPLNVTVNGNKELFWKFFLTSDSDVREIISDLLSKKEDKPQIKKIEKVERKQEVKREEPKVEVKEEKKDVKKETPKVEVKEEKKEVKKEEPKVEEKQPEPKQDVQKRLKKEVAKKTKGLDNIDADIMAKVKELIKHEMQKTAELEPEAPEIKKPEDEEDEFFKTAFDKFKEKDIAVIEYDIIKANNEFECVISVPSAIGTTDFFCKAKNKKRFSDGDLSSAFVKGQSKQLQTLFVGPGDLTKKAQVMLDEDFKNQVFFLKV